MQKVRVDMMLSLLQLIILTTDAAEEILNKCTVSDPQWQNPAEEQYCVTFNYEFVEDSRGYGQDNDVG